VRSSRTVLSIGLFLLASAAGGSPPQRAAVRLTDEMRSVYLRMFHDGIPLQTARALQRQARNLVASADFDGGGLSRHDIELARGMEEASTRVHRLASYFGSDLNGDGVLTLDEYKAVLRRNDVEVYYVQSEAALERGAAPPAAVAEDRTRDDGVLVRMFNDTDADHDGRLTLLEVYAYNPPVAYAPAQRFVEAEQYLVLDSNGDGTVTMAEVDATLAAFLDEQTAAGVGPRPAPAAGEEEEGSGSVADVVRCPVPRPSARARIVRLGAEHGGQLSNVALGGQNVPTYVASVEIEPGDEPLYIIATSYAPMVWRLSGATARVEAFVGSSFTRDGHAMWPAVGVTGLPARRFHTAPFPCFGEFDQRGMQVPLEGTEAGRLVMRRLQRRIDAAFGASQLQGVRIPSSQSFAIPASVPPAFANLGNEAAAREWRDFLQHFHGGIASLDPREIVTRADPELFQVAPYQAGLAQLLEAGALAPARGGLDFEIRRQIRFPAGLAGGYARTFVLPDGVPPPLGDPAHSRVMSGGNPRLCLIGCR
jgi:hypothetical protein